MQNEYRKESVMTLKIQNIQNILTLRSFSAKALNWVLALNSEQSFQTLTTDSWSRRRFTEWNWKSQVSAEEWDSMCDTNCLLDYKLIHHSVSGLNCRPLKDMYSDCDWECVTVSERPNAGWEEKDSREVWHTVRD